MPALQPVGKEVAVEWRWERKAAASNGLRRPSPAANLAGDLAALYNRPCVEQSSVHVEAWLAAEQSSPSQHVAAAEEAVLLAQALAEVPESQREAIKSTACKAVWGEVRQSN
jgi:DNA-directed RNA polymerase specialized sigma24 family protein